jgi:cell division protein FtsB
MTQPPRAQQAPGPDARSARSSRGVRTPASGAPAARPHFTGRAAVVAIVLCGIALSLAYPVREYIAQRRQIDQLEAQSAQIQAQREALLRESKLLHSPAYIAQQARDRLHMCLPTQVCYEIIGNSVRPKTAKVRPVATPWYAKVWSSVQEANTAPPAARKPGIRPRSTGRPQAHRARRTHSG